MSGIELKCPHCDGMIIVQKINCGIFRHGYLKKTGKQIKPHLNKKECDRLIKNNLIYGCGLPFKIVKPVSDEENYTTIPCDYL